jgi:hypothetical protein
MAVETGIVFTYCGGIIGSGKAEVEGIERMPGNTALPGGEAGKRYLKRNGMRDNRIHQSKIQSPKPKVKREKVSEP